MNYFAIHELIKTRNWMLIRKIGDYHLYLKDGKTYPVPHYNHFKIGVLTEKKIRKDMNL